MLMSPVTLERLEILVSRTALLFITLFLWVVNTYKMTTQLLYTAIGYSLIDMTSTGVIVDDTKYRNQQRNWESMKQVLSLRAKVKILTSAGILYESLTRHQFGKSFKGKHYIWVFQFGTQTPEVFSRGDSEFDNLELDFENVPVALGLSETVELDLPLFCTFGDKRNIYFKRGESINIR